MTVKAMNHFSTQLAERTGKRVFVAVSANSNADPLMSWEVNNDLNVAIGSEYSTKSLLIMGDYETEIGAAIETPGVWTVANGLIWEQAPGVYRGWPPFAIWYPAGSPPVIPPVVDPPVVHPVVPPVVQPGQEALIAAINRLCDRLDVIISKMEA
jgi:hypothetical protein